MTKTAETPGGAPLNDMMIAMDVVDTLRHDERIALHELNDDARRSDLIKRLRALYKGQGIDVPDRILEEGVKALAEERFVYDPPKNDWRRALAEVYVTRGNWGPWVLAGLAAVLIAGAAWFVLIERPRARQADELRAELTTRLPAELKMLAARIGAETKLPAVTAKAKQLRDDGLQAAADGASDKARQAAATLRATLDELRREFTIRIVQRKGQLSGLWRIPKINPNARNYYLIVEAIGPDGAPVQRALVNEETGKRESVKSWAIRVPKNVLNAVQADKADDGIIQNATIGEKTRGRLKPDWRIEVSGGALTRW